jgi:hypothetical protein
MKSAKILASKSKRALHDAALQTPARLPGGLELSHFRIILNLDLSHGRAMLFLP